MNLKTILKSLRRRLPLYGRLASAEAMVKALRAAHEKQTARAEEWRRSYLQQVRLIANPQAINPAADLEIMTRPGPLREPRARALRSEPVVSFVLASYERCPFLKATIESIREQDVGGRSEIIVVDGGSRDGSVAWLTAQTDVISIIQHNRVPEEGMKRRRSWGYFINLAFRAAKGKWVCMVSDDCLIVPGSVAKALQHVERLEASGRPVGGGAFFFRNWPHESRYYVQHTLGGMLMVNHGLFLREALADINYAEEDIFDFYKADSDMALKLWHAGYEIVSCPDSYVEHFMLPTEALRIGNLQTMNDDRDRLIRQWEGVFVSSAHSTLFTNPYQSFVDYEDPTRTVDRFLPMMGEDERALAPAGR